MTFNEVFEGFKSLNAADQNRLVEAARQFIRNTNRFHLAYGAKVQFKHSKTGAIITGTYVRMKQKYAEVMANQNQYGMKTEQAVRWSCPPEMLIPLTPEQVKLAEAKV